MKKLIIIPFLFLCSNIYSGVTGGSYGTTIKQQVLSSEVNSSTINLLSGQTFTGSSATTLGVNAIQVSLKTDQNCIVYIEQSPDGTNWDLIDSYNYYSSINNFGVTVQAINSYVRVRVKNTSSVDTTYFRLQTVLCPIVEALPRSLDSEGHLKVAIQETQDDYGFKIENTPNGEIRAISPVLLVGRGFEGNVIDTSFFTSSVSVTGSTVTQGNGTLVIKTSTTASAFTKFYSNRRARYTPNQANVARFQILVDTPMANNSRKWGIGWHSVSTPTISDGAYFELFGTTPSVVVLKGGKVTRVESGSFNGKYGATYVEPQVLQTFEIYWNNKKIIFAINDVTVHIVTASTETNMNTVQHRLYFENSNFGVTTGSTTLTCLVAGIRRLGNLTTQPTSKFVTGQTTQVLKTVTGNLHELVISGVSNSSVITLYDNTSASGDIIWTSGTMGAQTQPFSLDMKDLPFFNGLTIAITGANSNCLVVYE